MNGPLLTEAQARERVCCVPGVGRPPSTTEEAVNLSVGRDVGLCRGARCMGWRWSQRYTERWRGEDDPPLADGWEPVPRVGGGFSWVRYIAKLGFCGRAGGE